MKIRKTSADAMTVAAPVAKPAQPSARDLQRQEVERQILDRLTDETVVLAITPEDGEKPATLRGRILRVAKDRQMEVAVQMRVDADGRRLLVGLMTPARRPTRGRRPKT